jgi:hypothetical protein
VDKSLAEIRLECLRLAYRADQVPDQNVARAEKLFEWVTEKGKPETDPPKTPKSKS